LRTRYYLTHRFYGSCCDHCVRFAATDRSSLRFVNVLILRELALRILSFLQEYKSRLFISATRPASPEVRLATDQTRTLEKRRARHPGKTAASSYDSLDTSPKIPTRETDASATAPKPCSNVGSSLETGSAKSSGAHNPRVYIFYRGSQSAPVFSVREETIGLGFMGESKFSMTEKSSSMLMGLET